MAERLIIAEIGINHDGSTDTARALIEAAAGAGAHAIKLQYRNLDNAYADVAREIGDEILRKEITRTYLPPSDLSALADHARDLGLQAGISFFHVADMKDFEGALDRFSFFKVPSVELTNAPLIDAMIATGRRVYLSTGAHQEEEIEAALGRLAPDADWMPLHCVSNYPTAPFNARLGYLRHLQRRWGRPVGYSSHDDHQEVCLLALQLGAVVVERHLTCDRAAAGLDHSSSSTPDELSRLCALADDLDVVIAGDEPRSCNQGELMNRQTLGRSFFTRRDLAAGEVVSEEDLVYRAPNVGLGRDELRALEGRPLVEPVPAGSALRKTAFTFRAPLSDEAIAFARRHRLSLPVRVHDFAAMCERFPVGAFELHLSFGEVQAGVDPTSFPEDLAYSVHLPDYVSSTELMDPFSPDPSQREGSLDVLDKTVRLARELQQQSGAPVPVVGSFSRVHGSLPTFYEQLATLVGRYADQDVVAMPQWLPPIAWYFGGSVRLHAVNSLEDVALLRRFELPVCLDVCHLLMGADFFGFSAGDVLDELAPQIAHLHIADAAGVDGEGVPFGEGAPGNLDVIRAAIALEPIKVIEVWQGHLDEGAGFQQALTTLAALDE